MTNVFHNKAIFTRKRYLNIPDNYRKEINEQIIDNVNLENNIRRKFIKDATGFKRHVLEYVINNSVLTMDLCFQVGVGEQTVSWESTAPTLVADNFVKQATVLLNEQCPIYPAGASVISAKKTKLGLETFYCMISKHLDNIDVRYGRDKQIIVFIYGRPYETENVILNALRGYFGSHIQWLDSQALDSVMKQFIKGLKDGCKTGEIELELYTPELDFFKNLSCSAEDADVFFDYVDGIAKCIKGDRAKELFGVCYIIQLLQFYRNALNLPVEPTHLMPVLYGRQNVGKTYSITQPFNWLGNHLKKQLVHYEKLADLPQESAQQACFNSNVVCFDDISPNQSKKSVSELKELLSKDTFSKVGKYIEKNITIECRFVAFATTNHKNWLPDIENRRCPTFEVETKIRHAQKIDFLRFFKGLKWLAENDYKDVKIATIREQYIDEISAMHANISEHVSSNVEIVLDGLKTLAPENAKGNVVLIPKGTLYSFTKDIYGKEQIDKYINTTNAYRSWRIPNRTVFRGVLLRIDTSNELIQSIVTKRLPATFFYDDVQYTTLQFSELLRTNTNIAITPDEE